MRMAYCPMCKHFLGISPEHPGEIIWLCKAFPNGIPEELQMARKRHDASYPGDNGFRYEKENWPEEDENGELLESKE